MGFKMGIVGLPNVGKSTLFNALTQTAAAQAANYPFCTIEPNTGDVAVPEPRLNAVATIIPSKEIIPARINFVDIAGLVRGASKGEGLGNQFLANIRDCDAVAFVTRCFIDDDITHVEGRVDPIADAETVETELMLADLDSLERRVNAVRKKAQGGDKERIYLYLFFKTFLVSGIITVICLLLAFPIAHLLAVLPMSKSSLLMIMVLLPFWTSLLVRTTAWIALLQEQGIVNDMLVGLGLIGDDGRLSMMYNMTGTIVAMTHVLLPFMILPLYSVMRVIPPSYARAARSLGATSWTTFRRVYLPQTLPGIAAGSLLVFILAVGYYITPALVGGADGQLISNLISFHMSKSNWSLAAAIAGMLLVAILALYWLYDQLIGIDRLKLG